MIGIIILNYNTWEQTEECINSIIKTISIDYMIYLVDNASSVSPSDAFFNYITSNDKITFIRAHANKGYAAGNNIGIKAAYNDGCDMFLITNNDVIFYNGSIEKMMDSVNEHGVGIVGPKVYLENGDVQEIHLGCKMSLLGKYLYILRKTPLSFLSKNFVSNYLVNKNTNKRIKVYGVSGCCFIMKRECFEDVGYFDEGTFMYEEENILSVKMETSGWISIYDPTIYVLHKHGKSTKFKSIANAYMMESEVYYLRKYLKSPRIAIAPLILIRMSKYIFACRNDSDYRRDFLFSGKKVVKALLNKK